MIRPLWKEYIRNGRIPVTRVTRMPVFLEYHPPPHDYPYYRLISYPFYSKSKLRAWNIITNLSNRPDDSIKESENIVSLEVMITHRQQLTDSIILVYVMTNTILIIRHF